MLFPESIRIKAETILGTAILHQEILTGGDINHALLLHTATGNFFLKYNSGKQAQSMFQEEAFGLEELAKPAVIKIPRIVDTARVDEFSFLILEYIPSSSPTRSFWEDFGQQLSELHRINNPSFGFFSSNFIGRLPQTNQLHPKWHSFFIEERIVPQLKLGRLNNLLNASDEEAFQAMFKQLPSILPEEAPSLLHGDLWSGNFICSTQQEPVLIDPAVYYGHREMDLAMTALFGGFPPPFYDAYQHHFPTTRGLEERIKIYQLYYLLVHVNLFGVGYLSGVRAIVDNYK